VSTKAKCAKPELSPRVKQDTTSTEQRPTKPPPRLKLRKTKIAIDLSQNSEPSIFASGYTDLVKRPPWKDQPPGTEPQPIPDSFIGEPLSQLTNGIVFDGTIRELPIRNRESIDPNVPYDTIVESIPCGLPEEQTRVHYVLNIPADRRKSRSTNDYNSDELPSDEERGRIRRGHYKSRSLQDEIPVKVPKNPVIRYPDISSAFSPPTRQPSHGVSKPVQWDPAVISAGPIIQLEAKEPRPELPAKELVQKVDQNLKANDKEIQDCMETIKAWKRNDRRKVAQLLKAVRELDSSDDEKECPGGVRAGPQNKVYITEIQSLDPRVPEFKSCRAYSGTNFSSTYPLAEKLHTEPLTLKENMRLLQPTPITLSHRSKVPKKRIVIDDDSNPWCREVDFSSQWYSRMQLDEFMKKYPLTGQKAPAAQRKVPASRKANPQPVAKGRHAAVIQQRLEFLLLKEKERKAAADLAARAQSISCVPLWSD
jgi:hypothetical protein